MHARKFKDSTRVGGVANKPCYHFVTFFSDGNGSKGTPSDRLRLKLLENSVRVSLSQGAFSACHAGDREFQSLALAT